jgi:hypothetical protein
VDEEFLYLLFLRLNTESVKLSPQELRQALHPGPFLSFADEFTLNSKVLMDMLKIKKPDFRMRDVELVVRYYAFRNFLANYTGDLKAFLDETCEVLNKNWDKNEVILKKQASELEKAIEITEQIFGKYAFRKWNGTQFEKVFNRAIFDIMVYYFVQPDIGQKALEKKDEIIQVFKSVCQENQSFYQSIGSTTKSITAVHTRLSVWGEILRDNLNIEIRIPTLDNGRIKV